MRLALRELLSARRHAETFTMTFGGQNTEFNITVGYYDDGRLGEVFISGPKTGSEMGAVTNDGAVLVSIALQYGVPLETLKHSVSRDRDGKATTVIGAVLDRLKEIKTEKEGSPAS